MSGATLALDLGSTTGFALRLDGRLQSGAKDFKPGRHEGAGMQFVRFRGWLAELHANSGGLKAIYYEEVRRHLGTDASHVYGAFWGTLTAFCQEQKQRIPFRGIPVGTIKKFASGKGNASKEDMVAAVSEKWHPGHGFGSDEADAIALLAYVEAQG